MSERVGFVHTPKAAAYDLGAQHPLKPDRVLLAWWLIEAYGLDIGPNVERIWVDSLCSREALELVHTPEYIAATVRAGHNELGDYAQFGYGPGDNPIFPSMHEAASYVAEATRAGAEAVWTGRTQHAFNAAGGLHHAMPSRASGFCIYDDPAIAIAWLLAHGAERVAYVDIDVHHGDGVQAIFWNDPRVLTISIHEYGALFPGTGGPDETGGPQAPNSACNIPITAFSGDTEWLEAFHETVPPRIREFGPDIIVTQLGADGHANDPLANLQLTTHAFSRAYATLHALAHETSKGRWLATGGGGYDWANAVPRVWTLAFAEMCGVTLDDELPEPWRERAASRTGDMALIPAHLNDPV